VDLVNCKHGWPFGVGECLAAAKADAGDYGTQRNAFLKVAGFHSLSTGRF
jgi:hypothetical protein